MSTNLTSRLTIGSVIVLIGIFLLISTTGFVEMRSIWGWIAALFVLVGLWALIKSEFRNLVGPVMVIAIAGAFFLRNVGLIPDAVIGKWWPLFIVLFGLLIMISRSRRRQRIQLEGVDSGGEISVVSVFGSDDRRISSDRFRGAELVAVFGDSRLDLTGASIPDRPAVIEVMAMFGDAEIRVPSEWEVKLETMAIFGEINDRRFEHSTTSGDGPDLIVTGSAVFADIEIRD